MNVLEDTIEGILSALHYIEDQADKLLETLPDDLAKDTEEHLNNIYAALRDARTMTHGAASLAASDVPAKIEEIEEAKEHLAQIRDERKGAAIFARDLFPR